jgi:hypothetical protein
LLRGTVEIELRVEIVAGVTVVDGMDAAADAIVIVAETAANGRRRLRDRMRDAWMLCGSGLLRAGRGFRRARTRRSSCRRVLQRSSR